MQIQIKLLHHWSQKMTQSQRIPIKSDTIFLKIKWEKGLQYKDEKAKSMLTVQKWGCLIDAELGSLATEINCFKNPIVRYLTKAGLLDKDSK